MGRGRHKRGVLRTERVMKHRRNVACKCRCWVRDKKMRLGVRKIKSPKRFDKEAQRGKMLLGKIIERP